MLRDRCAERTERRLEQPEFRICNLQSPRDLVIRNTLGECPRHSVRTADPPQAGQDVAGQGGAARL